ncbi:MAG TPA: YjjG family noncanonical pyrimidine nucleotidase [Chondromyces sp.]|nr:YjjG family noncanonical pyrimidine nucleotidase [Chondromyces sp.]
MSYAWVLLDADGTLFDYDHSEAVTLAGTFAECGLPFEAGHVETYRRINGRLWLELERGTTTQERIRSERFASLFEVTGVDADPAAFSARYLANLARRTELIDGAAEVAARLAARARLLIVTNGLAEVQRPRLAASAVGPYIAGIVISEEVGSAKPDGGIFRAAFEAMGGPPKRDVLMVGDSPTSDIAGGRDFGIDTCWFNPARAPRPADVEPTFEIARLEELLEIVPDGMSR